MSDAAERPEAVSVSLPLSGTDADALVRKVHDRFMDGLSCTESIVESTCQLLAIAPGPHVRMATGFRAGMARAGCVCGALTGAIMAAGIVHGREDEFGSEADILRISRRLHDRFVERFSTTCCRVLNGSDFDSPEHDARCAGITAETMAILLDELGWVDGPDLRP